MDADETTYGDDFDGALASHLASCGRAGGYRVAEELKRSEAEVTEKVFFAGEDGAELGPFVRKRIDAASGLGRAYERLRAAQLLGLRCPNLPRVVDCWNDGRDLNVVMEWLPGCTLEEHVRAEGPSAGLAREAAEQLAAALECLHGGLGMGAPIVHRDLKPSNVMVVGGADGIPRTLVLIDLGIARTWKEGAGADTVRLGTRSYAPPEQFGFGQTGPRSDVYALGAVLYFCLTGEDPGGEGGPIDVDRFPDVPDDLLLVVKKAMSFDPDARYAGAAELAAAVAGAEGLGAGGPGAGRLVRGASAAAARARLPEVPAAVGKAWNALLAFAAAVLALASLWSVGAPTGPAAAWPVWFRALGFVVWMPGSFAAAALMLADKRRMRRRVRARACAAAIAGLTVIVLAIGMVAGVL